ncbi:MAG: hypothetical protein EP343_06710 [Deltaproteobacteria bacterium]|nr:MAG: hypothetical protein EP343_06710 [Deltaproteobacteria bacterium]
MKRWSQGLMLLAVVGFVFSSQASSVSAAPKGRKLKKNNFKAGYWWGDEEDDWVLEKKDAAKKAGPKSGSCVGGLSFKCGKSAGCKRFFGKIKFRCKANKKQLRSMFHSCKKASVAYCRSLKKASAKTRQRCLTALSRKCKDGQSVQKTYRRTYRRRRSRRRGRYGRRRR